MIEANNEQVPVVLEQTTLPALQSAGAIQSVSACYQYKVKEAAGCDLDKGSFEYYKQNTEIC